MNREKRALVLLNDLMFRVKVDEALRRAGFSGEYQATSEGVLGSCAKAQPGAIIIDLNYDAGRPLDLIAQLKNEPATIDIPILAYVSHVQVDLRSKAESLGCDRVVARSVLTQSLPEFLGTTH